MTMHSVDRRFLPLLAAVAVLGMGLTAGCSKSKRAGANLRHMGERVQVGPLIYTVLDAEWMQQLGPGEKPRLPQKRFLILKVNVTNSGGMDSTVPALTLEGANGETFAEQTDGEGVTDWLPILRRLSPAETLEGHVLFDAPQGAYRLRVREEADLAQEEGQERSELIEIPLNLRAPPVLPAR